MKLDVPKARKKVSEPTAAAHFLLDLRGCICEVFGVCGRLKVEETVKTKEDKSTVPNTGFFQCNNAGAKTGAREKPVK